MVFDSVRADKQLGSDLAVGQAVARQPTDLSLPGGELGGRIGGPVADAFTGGAQLPGGSFGKAVIGALNVPLESIAIFLLSLVIRRSSRLLATMGIAVAVAGLAGSFLSAAGQYAGSSVYLGLGAGGAERLASYPGSLWMLIIGITAMAYTRTWRSLGYSPQAP
jgi:hypothetical protein